MKNILISLISLSTLLSSCHAQEKGASFEPVAVIELFTSEGCSSCPPADKILAKYAHDPMYQGVKLFPLAFHVDYWNYLGWKDSFSSAEYSNRQKMYVESLGLSGAYTPQMIVNGTIQFVGSEENTLQQALSSAAHKKNSTSFTALTLHKNNRELKVEYTLQGDIKDCQINFALISLEVSTAVKRGENTGRKLSHSNVVRQFITQRASTIGTAAFENTSYLLPDNIAVIAYVQRIKDRQILTAAEVR